MNRKFNKVYSSNENLEVHYLQFNRPRSQAHIKSVAASIRKHGWFGTVIMIYTNLYSKKYRLYVIDGQHRVDAANLEKVPYRYEIVQVTNEEEIVTLMADLNNNSKGWLLHDYIAPWISLGLTPYKELLKIYQDTNLPLASLIRLYSGESLGGGETGGSTKAAEQYKKGTFVIRNREFADKVVKETLELRKIIKKIGDPFIMAFAEFYYRNQNRYSRIKMSEFIKKNKRQFTIADKAPIIRELLANYNKVA